MLRSISTARSIGARSPQSSTTAATDSTHGHKAVFRDCPRMELTRIRRYLDPSTLALARVQHMLVIPPTHIA
jgi:hypothetical protein